MNKASLTALAREHLDLARAAPGKRSSHTVYGGHEHLLRQTVIALLADQSLAEHESPGDATVHVLLGHVRLTAGETAWEGHPGDLITVPPARHALQALTDTVVLLTVAKSLQ